MNRYMIISHVKMALSEANVVKIVDAETELQAVSRGDRRASIVYVIPMDKVKAYKTVDSWLEVPPE
jgi:hypothetical protein